MRMLLILMLLAFGLLAGCTKSYPGDPETPQGATPRPARRMDQNGNAVNVPTQPNAPQRGARGGGAGGEGGGR
jgi:hypothetical protein